MKWVCKSVILLDVDNAARSELYEEIVGYSNLDFLQVCVLISAWKDSANRVRLDAESIMYNNWTSPWMSEIYTYFSRK